ncbi:hypothetical protein K503DRAFT_804554 [Rhizopogon vinicolor AM-OR11-026]|uniref:Uncharacterized protein n=1 Tax=Rhizopogon vinicolor AM-OR11-026 TaxID=1314800 RepID=A0A1B7MKT8_9AGAM|nr:hypothetical protein K503DRAFT_804554 [Rhizopogon vinicolor AM-OR11-026]
MNIFRMWDDLIKEFMNVTRMERTISMKSDIIHKRSCHDAHAPHTSLTDPTNASNTLQTAFLNPNTLCLPKHLVLPHAPSLANPGTGQYHPACYLTQYRCEQQRRDVYNLFSGSYYPNVVSILQEVECQVG